MSNQHITENAREILGTLPALFAGDDLPEEVALSVIHAKQLDVPSAGWSMVNRIIMRKRYTNDARTFKQWQAAGRRPKKGAKAFYILEPLKKWITDEDESGEKVRRRVVYGWKAGPRFRLEDTEGEPVETADYEPLELPPLAEVPARMGVKVSYAPFEGGAYYGTYAPGRRAITLMTHEVGVFFHELAHAGDAAVAAARGEKLKGGQDPDQEIVAETVAAVLAYMYGFEGYVAHSRAYITDYACESDAGLAVARVLKRVEEVLNYILSFAAVPSAA